jgi:hypothetical protein
MGISKGRMLQRERLGLDFLWVDVRHEKPDCGVEIVQVDDELSEHGLRVLDLAGQLGTLGD